MNIDYNENLLLGNLDFWIIKVDQDGNLQWQECLGGSGADLAYSIIQTKDSDYVVCGTTYSYNGDVTNNHGFYDSWVLKISSTGAIRWQKCYGGISYEVSSCIIQTSDDGFAVSAITLSNDGDVSGNHDSTELTFDAWIFKLDSAGNMQWQKCLGGSGNDGAYSLLQSGDGGFVLAGYSNSIDGDLTDSHGNYDAWVVKLDDEGNLQWQKCIGGGSIDVAAAIAQTHGGNFAVAGYSYSKDGDMVANHGNWDCFVTLFDANGAVKWTRCYGGSGGDKAFSVIATSDGGIAFSGETTSHDGDVRGIHDSNEYSADCRVVKLDSEGNILWQQCIGGSRFDHANSLVQVSNETYVIAGLTYQMMVTFRETMTPAD